VVKDISLLYNVQLALRVIKAPTLRLRGAVSMGVKQRGPETDNLPPYRAEVNNGGAVPPLPHICSWHGA
jgi:hypothetical protein